MRYDLLNEDDFVRFAGLTKREIRRAYGLNMKISRLMLEDAYRAWYPVAAGTVENYERYVDAVGEVVDPVAVLRLMRNQIGLLCALLGGQPRLLTVTRDTPKDAKLTLLLKDGFATYPQMMFAILLCGHILLGVTYALVGREIEITDDVFVRLVGLASRAKARISELRSLADVMDPLPPGV